MDAFIESLLDRLLATSVQTALLVALVWALCRYVSRLSPSVQGWLWWLVALQAVVGLAASPIQLPWLPPTPAVIPEALPAMQWNATAADSISTANSTTPYVRPLWLPAMFLLWLCGLVVMSWSTLRYWRRGQQLLKTSSPCADPQLLQALAHASETQGLPGPPRLHLSHRIDSPLLIGHVRPVLLLPAATSLSGEALELVFAHELAHLRRGDLWWGCVPALARHLFFFHPLVHLAVSEYSIAREAACDAAAVGTNHRSREDYGRLLLQLGTSPESSAGIAVASPTFRALRRRLTLLQSTSFLSRASSTALLIVVGAVGVMPLRLVEAAAAEATSRVTPDSTAARANPAAEKAPANMPPARAASASEAVTRDTKIQAQQAGEMVGTFTVGGRTYDLVKTPDGRVQLVMPGREQPPARGASHAGSEVASVELAGFVNRPGRVAWRTGLRLTDVIGSVDQLQSSADARHVLIRRESGADRKVETLSADLMTALGQRSGAADLLLHPRDQITVFGLDSSVQPGEYPPKADVTTGDGRLERPWAVITDSTGNAALPSTIATVHSPDMHLLQRMDGVTGGASATYGSGAMAGVVNMVLNNRLKGLQLSELASARERLAELRLVYKDEHPEVLLQLKRITELEQASGNDPRKWTAPGN